LSFASALEFGCTHPDAAAVSGKDVWLVHPWNLGEVPAALPKDAVTVGVFVTDFHRHWPWSEKRWRFVCSRMAEITHVRWEGDAASIGEALQSARTVSSTDDLHIRDWLAGWAKCKSAPALFPMIDRRCDSFFQWWNRASRGVGSATELLRTSAVSCG
jgi:deoxyribodipyrimidine photo-lyase